MAIQQKIDLKKYLFKKIGYWSIDTVNPTKIQIQYVDDDVKKQNDFIYAFVVKGQIKYIGESRQTISQRMSGYRNPGKTTLTNIHINKEIKNSKFPVEVYVRTNTNVYVEDLQMNVSARVGIEEKLISAFKLNDPEIGWNIK